MHPGRRSAAPAGVGPGLLQATPHRIPEEVGVGASATAPADTGAAPALVLPDTAPEAGSKAHPLATDSRGSNRPAPKAPNIAWGDKEAVRRCCVAHGACALLLLPIFVRGGAWKRSKWPVAGALRHVVSPVSSALWVPTAPGPQSAGPGPGLRAAHRCFSAGHDSCYY